MTSFLGSARTSRIALFALGTLMLCAVSAYGATLITSAQIRDNTIQSRDVRNGTLGVVDLSVAARRALKGAKGATGATGPAGPAGASGGTGAAGPRGLSAWDTIPSGTTITNAFRHTMASNVAGSFQYTIQLPGIAPTKMVNADVNFAPAAGVSDGDAACTGTLTAPTAPPGKVCLYVNFTETGTTALNGIVSPEFGDRMFSIVWNDTGADAQAGVAASWAYTAP
jgi:hypothetical protein